MVAAPPAGDAGLMLETVDSTLTRRPPRTEDIAPPPEPHDDVDLIGEDSFPASDPPSWWAGAPS
jgi:hypothetical protein